MQKPAPGTPPGFDAAHLVRQPDSSQPVRVLCIDYSPENVQVEEVADVADFIGRRRPLWSKVRWINIDGLGQLDVIRAFQGAGWGTGIIGVIAVALGLWLLFNAGDPGMLLSLAWAAGIFAIVGGIAGIFMSFRIKGIQDKLQMPA